MIKGVLSFYVTTSHPDYKIAREQSNEARRLYNTINKLKQEKSNLYKDPKFQTEVANSLKIDLTETYSEKWRKQIEQAQNVQLPQKVAQHVGKQADKTWQGIIDKRSKGQKARDPKFKKQYCEVRYTNQSFSHAKKFEKENRIVPSGWSTGLLLPNYVLLEQVESLQLIPRPDGFELKMLYIKDDKDPKPTKQPTVFAGGDLGLDNLITIVTTDSSRPKIVNGKGLKSLNRFFNKKIGQLKSNRDLLKYNKQKGGEIERINKEISRLWFRRDKQVSHFLNSASNEVVKYLQQIGVQEFVIGWNIGFKDSINIGKKNNQNFVSVPHTRFRDLLVRKCVEVGIKVIIQEESYTSKASFIDGDFIPVFGKKKGYNSFNGERITRGEYRTVSGIRIHSDVNGAWNILRKCKPSIGWSSRVVVYPENLRIKF